jgi:hypothetical protein
VRILLTLMVFLTACEAPEPAPEDVDELMSFVFRHYELEDDNQARSLADAADNLLEWFEGRSWIAEDSADPDADYDAGFGATISTLTSEALDSLSPPSATADSDGAIGVMVARWQDCSLADIDRIYLDPGQFELFPGNYNSYERSAMEDIDCFADGECDRANWRTEIGQTQLIYSYTMDMASGIRRIDAVPASDDLAAPIQARLSRTWMLDEPELTPVDNTRFIQNYQLEFMVPQGSGLVHFYGQWTHLVAQDINTEAPIFLNSYVDGLYEYLDSMQGLCQEE